MHTDINTYVAKIKEQKAMTLKTWVGGNVGFGEIKEKGKMIKSYNWKNSNTLKVQSLKNPTST